MPNRDFDNVGDKGYDKGPESALLGEAINNGGHTACTKPKEGIYRVFIPIDALILIPGRINVWFRPGSPADAGIPQ
jgi:hypothetical protein